MLLQAMLNALGVSQPRRSCRSQRTVDTRRQERRRLFVEGLEDRRVLALAAPVNYDAGAAPQAIVSADFNNDDVLDLAVANYSSSDVSVLLGNVGGTFQLARSFATGANPVSLAVGDFDEDGILDLATANGDGNGNGEVSVLLGNGGTGTGTFQAPTGVSVGSPTSVAVGDFNGDGHLDLGVTSVYYYDLYQIHFSYANVLLGNGAGGFSGPNGAWLDWGYATTAIAANLNGDTSPTGHAIDDFVAANGAVYVVWGDTSGALQTASYWSAGNYSQSVAAADINGDQAIDLVAANYYGNDVGVLLNDGLGGFGAAQNYPVGNFPTAVVVGDFNHDTTLDIATTNSSSANIKVLYGQAGGAFAAAVNVAASPGAFALTGGDFNGDGWLDAATANPSSNSVSVLINDRSWPAAPASLSIGDVIVTEGNAGMVAASFAVTRSGDDLAGTATVNYSTANGGALAGSDYIAVSDGALTFGPGETTKTITILVNSDLTDEYDQVFYVHLLTPSEAVIVDGLGIGTILDDDPEPTITITPKVSAKEGPNNRTTSLVFLVTLSAASEKDAWVNFATVNDTASTADYFARSGTLVFAPGVTSRSISVPVFGDKSRESNETFFVNLSGAANATIAVAQGIGEILDDDSPGGKRSR